MDSLKHIDIASLQQVGLRLSSQLAQLNGQQLGVKCAVAGGFVLFTKLVWELLFSPLRKFPGPWVAKLTNIWRAIKAARGDVDLTQLKLHRKYGSAVRIGPNCVSLSDPNLIGPVYRNGWIKVSVLFVWLEEEPC